MSEKLTWEQIKEQYDNEWVQLIDYDWDDTEPYPTAGIVAVRAPTRKEFNALSKQSSALDAARIYVGKPKRDPNTFIWCNLYQYTTEN